MTALTMHKRFLTTAFLAVAFLFSQGGTFLIASLCPHLGSGLASCEMQVTQAAAIDEHEGHMQMESMEMESTPEQSADDNVLGQPTKPCEHCAVHSRSGPDASLLRVTEAGKHSGHLALPPLVSRVVSVPTSFVTVLSARAHGPPGDSTRRHVLINIFRI